MSETAIVDEREELMVSPNGRADLVRRKAHFMKPSAASNLASLSLFPDTPISDELDLPLDVEFKGWHYPHKDWTKWVDRLHPKFQSLWREVGIFDAIMASKCRIWKHPELLLRLASKWCPETNTFVFSWGEATITLEDVMVLGGYSILGDPFYSSPIDEESEEIEAKLDRKRIEVGKTKAKKATHSAWMVHFMDNESEIEHEAFLVYWLIRFVFPGHPHDTVTNRVFRIAVHLARGKRIALAPAVLASIYGDLTLLKRKVVASVESECEDYDDVDDRSKMTLWAPFQVVEVWIWERFVGLGPCPNSIGNDGPRLDRWDNLKIGNVRFVLEDNAKCFKWRPYVETNNNMLFGELYGETETWVLVDDLSNIGIKSFARCLRASELVGMGCINQYLPHRVARQFGFDQDVPDRVTRCKETPETAWKTYINGKTKLYIPSRVSEPSASARYQEWWKQCLAYWKPSKGDGSHTEIGDSIDEAELSKDKKERVLKRNDNQVNLELSDQSPDPSSFIVDDGSVRSTEPLEMRGCINEDELVKSGNEKQRASNPSSGIRSSSLPLTPFAVDAVKDKQAMGGADENVAHSSAYNKENGKLGEPQISELEARIIRLENSFREAKARNLDTLMPVNLGEKEMTRTPKFQHEDRTCEIEKVIAGLRGEFGSKLHKEHKVGNWAEIDQVVVELKEEFKLKSWIKQFDKPQTQTQ